MDLMAVFENFGISFALFGLPIHVSVWTIALAVLIGMSARVYIARQMREHPNSSHLLAATGATITVFGSVIAHEAAHGVVGYFRGLTTIKSGFTWWGAYVMFDQSLLEVDSVTRILAAIAGPLTNIMLAFFMAAIVYLSAESRFENAVQFGAYLNFRLAVLNMLPILGLDGSKVLDGLLSFMFPREVVTKLVMIITLGSLFHLLGRKSRSGFSTRFERWIEQI